MLSQPCLRAAVLFFIATVAFAQPKRIVSTAPSLTELLYALGLGDRVVAVTDFCHYPPEAAKKPKIGGYTQPNLEAITAQKPDLVIIQTNPIELKRKLETMRLRVLEVEQGSIESLYQSMEEIGKATGVADRARQLHTSIEKQLGEVRQKAAGQKPTRMMFVVGRSPNSLEGLVVVGRTSYLNQLIQLAGGENIFKDAMAPYPNVSLEEVMARNPDVILDMGDMTITTGVTEAHKQTVVRLWDRARTLNAVKNHRVYPIAADVFVVPGPRIVEAAREFLRLLHPEVAP
jgi:iron complex transport system substrate-binding protein